MPTGKIYTEMNTALLRNVNKQNTHHLTQLVTWTESVIRFELIQHNMYLFQLMKTCCEVILEIIELSQDTSIKLCPSISTNYIELGYLVSYSRVQFRNSHSISLLTSSHEDEVLALSSYKVIWGMHNCKYNRVNGLCSAIDTLYIHSI